MPLSGSYPNAYIELSRTTVFLYASPNPQKEHNVAVNRVDVLQVVLVDAQAVLSIEPMSASDPSRTCLLHIVIWVDDVENSVGVAALRGGEDNDLVERRDFLQKLLEERPKQRIHGDGVRAVCDLR